MAYVDFNYYSNTFDGSLEQPEVDKLLDQASDQVDRLTYGRIRHRGFDNLTEYQQEMIRKAVCHQAEFLHSYGEYLSMPLSGFSAGDISLSFSAENQGAGGIVADKKVISCLAQTGLSSRRL